MEGNSVRRPWFPLYVDDWRTSGKVKRMTNQERGCYVELMCYQWEEGFVPDDLKELANICGEPLPAMRRMWKRLEPCFPKSDDGHRRNPRVERERAKADEVSGKRRASALQMHQQKQEQVQDGSTPFASPPVTTQVTVPQEAPTTTKPTTTLVGLKPDEGANGRQAHPRTALAIREHLAATLSAVQAGQRDRLHADEMRTLQAELVFAYWQAKCGHERALLDDKRLTRLKRQLEENGGNVHELLYAVDGWAKDPTFKRLKDEGRELDGIQNIFTDRERIERLAGHCKGHRDGIPHAMATKYLEAADVPAH